MVKVSIIGSGNVAQHLIAAFLKCDAIELDQVYARNREALRTIVPDKIITDNLSALEKSDLIIIAVSDSAVAEVSKALPFSDHFVVHTSGSLPADAIDSKNRRGVFYPIQTFSKTRELDFNIIPICIEALNPGDFALLDKVARSISGDVVKMNSEQRKALHVAAVFVNNFTNHLLVIAEEICQKNNLEFELLTPLIRETAEKAISLYPTKAQTGPAVRNDQVIIETHMRFLSDERHRNIYQMLTNSIQNESRL